MYRKRFTIGDIHGNYKGLLQVMERSGFQPEHDLLISLGDVVDGHSETPQVVEHLLSLPNLIAIRGNHDSRWGALDWFENAVANPHWVRQGGQATIDAYTEFFTENPDKKEAHIKFFKYQHDYYVDDDNNVFIHGGIYPMFGTVQQMSNRQDMYWDRNMWERAMVLQYYMENGKEEYVTNILPKCFREHNNIFIGHTHVDSDTVNPQALPVRAMNVWNIDTGAGYSGKLTIMDIDTHEYWQSDFATDLYTDYKGR